LPLQHTVANPAYLRYAKQAKERGDYIILDNGAAEGDLVDTQTLLSTAALWGAHEIVGPDILDDQEGTLELMQAFLGSPAWREREDLDVKLMGVLQGKSHGERRELLYYYADQPDIKVLGIPKVCVKHEGSDLRAYIAQMVMDVFPSRFEIHLLGASPAFVDELQRIDFPPGIRSTDSTLPYKFTWGDQRLGTDRNHVKRWPAYFAESKYMNHELLDYNIMTYMRWARNA